MIGYLKGEVTGIYDDRIVIEVNNIGYNVCMPSSSIAAIDGIGSTIKVYTYLHVREDAMLLYGFLTKDDLEFYKLLIQVNGIGPKGALVLLSVMTVEELRFAIIAGDSKAISKAPGIGAKTAQRLIIDLKDKVDIFDMFDENGLKSSANGKPDDNKYSSMKKEVVEALVALGYSQTASYKAVNAVDISEEDDVESILKKSLRLVFSL